MCLSFRIVAMCLPAANLFVLVILYGTYLHLVSSQCGDGRPRMKVMRIDGKDRIPFGDPVEVLCSGSNATNLIMTKDENKLLAVVVNDTTIRVLAVPGLRNLNYFCTDELTACKTSAVIGLHMEVISPSIYRDEDGSYIIPAGEIVEVYCTGPSAEDLVIKVDGQELATEKINETTVSVIGKLELRDWGYTFYCGSNVLEVFHILHIMSEATPVAENFRCVSHNYEFLNCTWKTNRQHSFTLYYVKDGSIFRICKKLASEFAFCVWDSKDEPAYPTTPKIALLMQTCNVVQCFNQTFHLDQLTIARPPPPYLEIVSISSRSIELDWEVPQYFAKNRFFDCKVQYWFYGIETQQLNVTVTPEYFLRDSVAFDLPCPDKYYEVRLSIKPVSAKGDEYWSDDAFISFYTEADSNEMDANQICAEKWKPKITKDVMLYQTDLLKHEVSENMLQFRKKLESLRRLRDRLKAN